MSDDLLAPGWIDHGNLRVPVVEPTDGPSAAMPILARWTTLRSSTLISVRATFACQVSIGKMGIAALDPSYALLMTG